MQKKVNVRVLPTILLLGFTLVISSGCAPKVRLRAQESLFKENPMKRIAIFSEGEVTWAGWVHGGVLDMDLSKKSLQAMLSMTEEAITKKGYSVTVSEPVRILRLSSANQFSFGAFTPSPMYTETYKVSDNYRINKSDMRELPYHLPAYEYPAIKENNRLMKALGSIFDQIEFKTIESALAVVSVRKVPLETFLPLKADMDVIRDEVDADTVCFHRSSFLLQTAGMKSVTYLIAATSSVDTFPFVSTAPNSFGIFLLCADTDTGKVLWQTRIVNKTNNHKPSNILFLEALSVFPEAGSPITAQCTMEKQEGPVWSCLLPEQSRSTPDEGPEEDTMGLNF